MSLEGDGTMKKSRLVVGMSGASGSILGIRLLQALASVENIETHLIISQAAQITLQLETDWQPEEVLALADVTYTPEDIGASIASGSFSTCGMIVVPCSIKTLSAVANSFAADLLARAADVTLKEGRRLLLVVRETPLHLGHLQLMSRAAELGAIIFPPVPSFYSRPETIDQLVDQLVGRILDRMQIENTLFSPWTGPSDGKDPIE